MFSTERNAVCSNGLRFVIEILDSSTLCILQDTVICEHDVKDFLQIFGYSELSEVLDFSIGVESHQLNSIRNRFAPGLEGVGGDEVLIRPFHWLDELPYKVHTGRELNLMLQGRKPLACFRVYTAEGTDDEAFAEKLFDKYAKEGVLIKHQYYSINPDRPDIDSMRTVLYALTKESWRINAFILMDELENKVKWNDTLERMEGMLLGYTDWENDAYFAVLDKDPSRRLW
jgi:hypothetical protein